MYNIYIIIMFYLFILFLNKRLTTPEKVFNNNFVEFQYDCWFKSVTCL